MIIIICSSIASNLVTAIRGLYVCIYLYY